MAAMQALRTFAIAAALGAAVATAHAQPALRPEVGKPLQQAGELLRAGKAREALAKVREAERVGGRSAAEQSTIDRMKAAAAQRAGDTATAIDALQSVYERAGGGEKGELAAQIAAAYAQQRNHARAGEWVERAVAAGNNGATVRQLQQYLRSASGDYASIAREAGAAVAAAERAGRRPDEADLLRLADAQQRTNQTAGYVATLEKLLLNYPKKDYWSAYLGRLPRKAGFADRYRVDVLRLRLASGTLEGTADFMELAQLSLQAGLPAEALRIIDQGYQAGALGTGEEAARHQRLRDLAVKQEAQARASSAQDLAEAKAAATGDALVTVGYREATLGRVAEGVALIEQGIAKGGLKRPEDARLRLGLAQLMSPQTKAAGIRTLRSVKGTDGVADVARLWAVVGSNGG